MYRRVLDFAKQNGLSIHENRKSSTICAYVVLDENGEYHGIEYIDKKARKTKLVPDFGSFSAVEFQPNPIVETVEHVFDKSSKKYPYWVKTMQSGASVCDSIKTVCNFINKYDSDEDFYACVNKDLESCNMKPKDVVSFRIGSDLIEDLDDWDSWLCSKVFEFKNKKGSASSGQTIVSSVSGELQEPCPPRTCPCIKNVPNDIKAAFSIAPTVYTVAMKESSYWSYGFEGAAGSQMGIDDAKLLAAGFEYLLSNEQHRNKDFGIIYLCDDSHLENLIHEALSRQNDEIDDEEIKLMVDTQQSLFSDILKSVYSGNQCPVVNSDAIFHMAKFNVPSQGRFYLSNVTDINYTSLQHGLYKWYNDTKIIDANKTFMIRHLYHILFSCLMNDRAKDITKQINIEFGKYKFDLLLSMFTGAEIPYVFYKNSIQKYLKAITCGDTLKTVWLQIIKCYLIRKEVCVMPELTQDNVSTAYACGQLFAVYERLQYMYAHQNSNKKLNKNLAQNYFSATIKQPGVFFPKLADLAVVYINGIHSSWHYTELLGDLSERIGQAFPSRFTMDEQGQFILGYYQQKGAIFKELAALKEANAACDADDDNMPSESEDNNIEEDKS